MPPPRPRKDPRLPPGLRERDGYYSWRDPQTGREYGLGRDRRQAIAEALSANSHIAKRRLSLVERISGAGIVWADWCDEFETILLGRNSKPNTLRVRRSQLKRLRSLFPPDMAVSRIDTRDCSEAIEAILKEGKHRSAQAFRSFLIDCFDRSIARGHRKDNPARVLDTIQFKVQRSRLTLDVFLQLYEATRIIWLRNAMALALVSGQDRDSVRNAKFADFRDGGWWHVRGKTGARIFLPFELRLAEFPLSLEDVVRQCRSTGIVSPYLIHQTRRIRGATLGKPIHPDVITRTFSAELRALGLNWGDRRPPTFHEIRSLSGRLYRQQGDVDPQELLGHRDPRTTAIYTDGRGEWVRVAVRKTTG